LEQIHGPKFKADACREIGSAIALQSRLLGCRNEKARRTGLFVHQKGESKLI
jgi:hypothetical protein